jgi:uncharacterized membrane protein YdbT with pleckstrin-like domain
MDLHGDERVIYSSNPSWRSQFGAHVLIVVGAILIGAVVLLAVSPDWIGVAVGIVLAVAGVAWLWVQRSRTTYVITTHRLRVREGFLAKEVQETRLDRIQNVTVSQSVPQRLLRVGTVDYDTAGDDGSRFRMTGVSNPDGVVRIVDRTQRSAIERDQERPAVARVEAGPDATDAVGGDPSRAPSTDAAPEFDFPREGRPDRR